MTTGLIDAKAAGLLLGVPPSWVLTEAGADRIPHVRLGRYVRFDPDALGAWWRGRMRGPTPLAYRPPVDPVDLYDPGATEEEREAFMSAIELAENLIIERERALARDRALPSSTTVNETTNETMADSKMANPNSPFGV